MRTRAVLVAVAISACTAASEVPSPSSPAASASSSQAGAASLIGEWRAEHECEHIVQILSDAGYEGRITANIEGNGLLPGAGNATADPQDPCSGTLRREHFHSFSRDGAFASFDWRHQQVDEGRYQIVDADTVRINGTEFEYRVEGDELALTPGEGAGGDWPVMVALPGKTWERVTGTH
jgi:hypothetical protein